MDEKINYLFQYLEKSIRDSILKSEEAYKVWSELKKSGYLIYFRLDIMKKNSATQQPKRGKKPFTEKKEQLNFSKEDIDFLNSIGIDPYSK